MTHSLSRGRFATALLLYSLFLAGGCQHRSAASTSFFPESPEVPDWTKAPEVRTFSADRLSDYIDGDAEKYLKAGVRSVFTADYKFKGQVPTTVDVYTMSNADGAKAIFESEPAMDAKTPALGDAARLYAQSLIFRKGSYLVRMVAYQDSPQLSEAMLSLGHAVERKLSR